MYLKKIKREIVASFSNINLLENIFLIIYSLIFSVFFVIGQLIDHEILDKKPQGMRDLNPFDIVKMLIIFLIVYFILVMIYRLIKHNNSSVGSNIKQKFQKIKSKIFNNQKATTFIENKINYKIVFLSTFISFVLFTPYLLTYFPGLVYGDSLSSIYEPFPYSNHAPVVYTILVRNLIDLSNTLNAGITGAILIYSIIQMFFLAYTISYLYTWIINKLRLKNIFAILFTAITSLIPYVANYSISMWRDPVFSMALVLLTLKLFDLILHINKNKNYSIFGYIKIFLLELIICFFRNNGIYVVIFTLLFVIIFWLIKRISLKKIQKPLIVFISISIAVCTIFYIVTIPVYNYAQIKPAEGAETYGPFINTIAYIYLCNGDLDQSDLDKLNAIIPLTDIEKEFNPYLVDNLKFSKNFNNNAINDTFIPWFIKISLKNPILSIKAMLSLNYGFWSVGNINPWIYDINVTNGAIFNLYEIEGHHIYDDVNFQNLFNNDFAYTIFPIRNTSIPISLINWIILLIVVFYILLNKKSYIISLLPVIGLTATILIASPIWYWPRYEFALQLLFPFFLFLLIILKYRVRYKYILDH